MISFSTVPASPPFAMSRSTICDVSPSLNPRAFSASITRFFTSVNPLLSGCPEAGFAVVDSLRSLDTTFFRSVTNALNSLRISASWSSTACTGCFTLA